MAQEFNSDPEGWQLTDTFGDRSLRIWVEILAIMDREKNRWRLVGGWDSVISRRVRQSPATVRRVVDWMLANGWLEVGQLSASGQPEVLRARNYHKFRRIAGEAQHPPTPTPTPTPNPTPTPLKKRSKKAAAAIDLKSSSESEWPSAEKLVALYNELTPDDCAAVQTLSPARRAKAEEYLKIFPKQEFWEQVFDRVHHSRFLRGMQNKNGHGSFHFDFDWMLTKGKDGSENVVKVAEGRYADERK